MIMKRVLLVGHCGADATYLTMAVRSALREAAVHAVDDPNELRHALAEQEADLVLFNRVLGYGFEPAEGVEMIRTLRKQHPQARMMLVSNYDEAQAAAVAAGALPGFGKREIGSPRVIDLLREALLSPPE